MNEENNRLEFSYILGQLRRDKGVTQRDAAKQLEITPATLSAYENGIKKPSVEVLVRLADFYDVSLDSLLRPEKAKQNALNSYGDAIRALAELDRELGGIDIAEDKNNPAGVVLTIHNETLRNFLLEYQHNQVAIRDFGGGYDMFTAWIEVYASRLDSRPLIEVWQEKHGLPDEAYSPEQNDERG